MIFKASFSCKLTHEEEGCGKSQKDQSTTYSGVIMAITQFVVFFLYKGKMFC
jgi:hypothetical protein